MTFAQLLNSELILIIHDLKMMDEQIFTHLYDFDFLSSSTLEGADEC